MRKYVYATLNISLPPIIQNLQRFKCKHIFIIECILDKSGMHSMYSSKCNDCYK
jgi:hypothetical protein